MNITEVLADMQNLLENHKLSAYEENEMQTESLKNFGMTLDELADYTPADEREAAKKERLLTGYKDAQAVRQIAGDKYEVAETFFDARSFSKM